MHEREIGLIDDIFKQTIGFEKETIVAWQTLKSAVLAQQANNSAMDAIALQKSLFTLFKKYMSSADSSILVKEVLVVVQQHQ